MALIPTRHQAGDAMCFAGVRRKFRLDEAAHVIPEQWQEFTRRLPLPGQVGREMYGITCDYDGTNIEYLAGVRVDTFDQLTESHPQGRLKIPDANYAVFVHHGTNDKIPDTWDAIVTWVRENGRYVDAHTPPLEIYGPLYNPNSAKSQFEIWFPVKLAETSGA